jgi:hypothetical protein
MTHEERRVRPEHHIVHDYANLVSSGLLITDPVWNDKLLKIAPVNSHVWHAFYMNCRKMFEFFQYNPSGSYLRARQFLANDVKFMFKHWTRTVQQHMEIHIMHVGGDRVTRNIVWTGADDKLYLEDFQMAWATFLANLKHEHKELFKDEIDHRLDSEFRHCGSLGKEFIL